MDGCFWDAYITASLNTQQAQRYHAAVVAEIEASGLADSVIESCKEQAIKNGYSSLDVKKNPDNLWLSLCFGRTGLQVYDSGSGSFAGSPYKRVCALSKKEKRK